MSDDSDFRYGLSVRIVYDAVGRDASARDLGQRIRLARNTTCIIIKRFLGIRETKIFFERKRIEQRIGHLFPGGVYSGVVTSGYRGEK